MADEQTQINDSLETTGNKAETSRRDFFWNFVKPTVIAAAGLAVLYRLRNPLLSSIPAWTLQSETWNQLGDSNEAFILENAEVLKNVDIGCSFSPDEWEGKLKNANFDDRNESEKQNMDIRIAYLRHGKKAIDVMVDELKMKEIRFGVRWDTADDKDQNAGKFSASEFEKNYGAYLDYLLSKNVNVCLNFGPVKTFRWPEQHVTQEVITNTGDAPEKGGTVNDGTTFAKVAEDYTNDLLTYIQKKYTTEQLARITGIQAENEPFSHFGERKWAIGSDFLKKIILIGLNYFPNATVLVNTPGNSQGVWEAVIDRSNIVQIYDLFEELIQERPQLKNKLVFGFDYYHLTPSSPNINGENIDAVTAQQVQYGTDIFEEIKSRAKNLGFKIEITEAQAEEWGDFKEPGNSINEFKFMLKRCFEVIDTSDKSVIRLWGIEPMLERLMIGQSSSEAKEIIDLVTKINNKPESKLSLRRKFQRSVGLGDWLRL